MKIRQYIGSIFLILIMLSVNLFIIYSANSSSDIHNTVYNNNERRGNNTTNNWPFFQYDVRRTGYNPNANYPNPGRLRWKTRINGTIGKSSPTISYNNIYIGAITKSPDKYQGIYKLDINGNIIWKYNTGGWVYSSVITDSSNNIYFCSMDENGCLYSLFNNGTLDWKLNSGAPSLCDPIIIDDKIFFTDYSGNIFSRYYRNNTPCWAFDVGYNIDSSPAYNFNLKTIYIGCYDKNLYSFNSNGTLNWNVTLHSEIFSTPTISENGCIFVGSRWGYLYAIYPNSTIFWKYKTDGDILSSTSFDKDENIYFGSCDGYFYSLTKNGDFRWRYQTGGEIWGSAAVDAYGNVYFGSRDSYIYCLDTEGNLNWRYKTNYFIESSPAIDNNGNAYIGSGDGYLYSIGALRSNPPTDFHLISSGEGKAKFNWGPPLDDGGAEILEYRVYRYSAINGWEMVGVNTPSDTYFEDTGLEKGIEYTYYGVAVNREGESDPSVEVVVLLQELPTAPIDLTITPYPDWIHLQWEPPIDDGGAQIEIYNVYRKDSSASFELIAGTTQTDHEDHNTEPNVEYSYFVSAVNTIGEGPGSEIVFGSIKGPPPPPDLIEVYPGDEQVRINWTYPIPDMEYYSVWEFNIYRDDEKIGTVDDLLRTFLDTGLENGEEYSYRISCINGAGEGTLSDEVKTVPGTAPGPPEDLIAELVDCNVHLSWVVPDKNGGFPIDGYLVQRKTMDSEYTPLIEVTDLNFSDDDIELGRTYWYRIMAENERGIGLPSNEVSIVVPAGYPPGPVSDPEGKYEDGHVKLIWGPPEDPGTGEIISYVVYRREEGTPDFTIVNDTGNEYYMDVDVERGTNYSYRISAVNDIGEGPHSDEISVSVPDEVDGEGKEKGFTWLVLIIIIIIILLGVGFEIGLSYILKRKKSDEIPNQEATRNNNTTLQLKNNYALTTQKNIGSDTVIQKYPPQTSVDSNYDNGRGYT